MKVEIIIRRRQNVEPDQINKLHNDSKNSLHTETEGHTSEDGDIVDDQLNDNATKRKGSTDYTN